MSTYFGYVNSAYSASASDYDSPSACYSDCNSYSADFYAENNMAHPSTFESALWEPFPPTKDDVHYVLNTRLIHLLPKFHGFAGECPHQHLEDFHIMCSSMKPPHVQDDDMFLKAFPQSLQGVARDWLYCLPSGCITSWEDLKRLFLDEFFPAQYGYNNDSGWNDTSLGWYDAPQQYQEPPLQNTCMPPPVQEL
ncbi:hypothetical protein LR48_Vigan04g138400 [Vigna angularis]|uniref:Retrotransposon gag domain-containing protein n=1 Tax=Phaseolus angularis TaxID=3914 RepID=A0A0L9UEP0_PHAAN|nr:hypothetical protein LR48_Vigan04g138400 [Vigna angularis]